ncbi:MAG: MerR family transcriptional regulator [Acidobacteria bacterium]|nr:MerR family transcriptional regulator [Acidobacteriota bacterium]
MLTIGQLARKTGIAASALRYYEAAGIVRATARIGNQRRYDNSAVARVNVVQLAQAAGFRLDEIKRLLNGLDAKTPPGPRWRALAANKIEEIDAQLIHLRHMRRILEALTRCNCPSIDDCVKSGKD